MSAPDFRDIVLTIAKTRPNMTVAVAVELAEAIENSVPGDLDDAQRLGEWAKRQPEVAKHLGHADSKIQAIKELRQLTKASLVQAKNAVEAAS